MNTLEEKVDTKSQQYGHYLSQHIDNVNTAYNWIKENIPEVVDNSTLAKYDTDVYELDDLMFSHDDVKYTDEEWDAYADYFYGDSNNKDVKDRFDYAWNHHQKNAPHHWQYWVLINDEDGMKALDMPYKYIIEMICDHWSFSWKSENLSEIFEWYRKNKNKMVLSPNTRKIYESILNKIKKIV